MQIFIVGFLRKVEVNVTDIVFGFEEVKHSIPGGLNSSSIAKSELEIERFGTLFHTVPVSSIIPSILPPFYCAPSENRIVAFPG